LFWFTLIPTVIQGAQVFEVVVAVISGSQDLWGCCCNFREARSLSVLSFQGDQIFEAVVVISGSPDLWCCCCNFREPRSLKLWVYTRVSLTSVLSEPHLVSVVSPLMYWLWRCVTWQTLMHTIRYLRMSSKTSEQI